MKLPSIAHHTWLSLWSFLHLPRKCYIVTKFGCYHIDWGSSNKSRKMYSFSRPRDQILTNGLTLLYWHSMVLFLVFHCVLLGSRYYIIYHSIRAHYNCCVGWDPTYYGRTNIRFSFPWTARTVPISVASLNSLKPDVHAVAKHITNYQKRIDARTENNMAVGWILSLVQAKILTAKNNLDFYPTLHQYRNVSYSLEWSYCCGNFKASALHTIAKSPEHSTFGYMLVSVLSHKDPHSSRLLAQTKKHLCPVSRSCCAAGHVISDQAYYSVAVAEWEMLSG